MYTHCFVCRRSLGENDEIHHLTIGRKVAFDVERGRLWVVCPHCGQWCLTPIEDRWETIAECEALFSAAEARVSTTNVGLARARDVELIRIGPALRDEIANWRYGPRLARRRRLARIAGGAAAIGAGTAAAGAIYLIGTMAVASSSAFVGGWLAMLGTAYAYKLRGIANYTPIARLALPDGTHHTLLRSHLPSIYLHRRSKSVTCVIVMFGDLQATYSEDDALHLLNRLLPHANWRGASPPEIDEATKRVDKAEHVCQKQYGQSPRTLGTSCRRAAGQAAGSSHEDVTDAAARSGDGGERGARASGDERHRHAAGGPMVGGGGDCADLG